MNFTLLTEEEIVANRDFLSSPFPLINAVVWGKQEGKIFSIEGNLLVIHKAGFAYFKPKEGFADYDSLFDLLLQSLDLPVYYHLYDAPAKLVEACTKKVELVNIKIRNRIQLKLKQSPTAVRPVITPPGFYIESITTKNLPFLSIFNLDLPNRFWRSACDFLLDGFGYCLFTDAGEPATICYSACIAEGVAEIDVATVPEFQQKGLAKKAVHEFVQYCIENNITANWDCFEDNAGSLKTAESLGFQLARKYKFISIYKVNSI